MIAVAGGILIAVLILGLAFVGLAALGNGSEGGWYILALAIGAAAWLVL